MVFLPTTTPLRTAIGEPLSRKKNVESQLHTPLSGLPMAAIWTDCRLVFCDFSAKDPALLGQRSGPDRNELVSSAKVIRRDHRSFDRLTKLLLPIKN
jgi:hypothetical protein